MRAARQAALPPDNREVERAGGLPFHGPTLARARVVAQAAALAAAVLAGMGLLGWVLDNAVLKSLLLEHAPAIKPNAAVGLVVLGLSLLVLVRRPRTLRMVCVARIGAVVAAGIGALTLVQYATGADLGIDQLLFRDDTAGTVTVPPGRMASGTALALVFGGLASLCLSRPRMPAWTAQVLGMAVLIVGMVRLYGYAYDVRQLEQFGHYTNIALHAALALVLVGLALFLARADEGAAGLVMNAGTTGVLGRWMLGTTLVAPPLLGWAVLTGEDAGLYGVRLGVALLVCGHVCAFTVVTFVALVVGRRIEVARVRAERQVRQNELLQSFMDHTPSAMFVKDLDGRYLTVNSRFEKVVRLPRGQLLGRRVEDVLPPESAAPARAADLEMLAQGTALQREDLITLPEGPRYFLTTLFPLNDRSGAPYAVCGVLTDTTEQVTARREIERANQRFHALLESAPDATLITDGDGVILMDNAQVEPLFGHPRSSLVGTRVHDLAPGRLRRHHAALLDAYLRQPYPEPVVLDDGLYGLRRDGSEFPAEVSISALRADEDMLLFLTVRDITERKRTEAERAERYQQQQRVAYTLQQSLMGEPPRLPHLPSAHRYLASVQEAGVGGDWFDVIPLDEARTGVVIGDVMGRGLDAAAVMGQLRAAAHALARTGMAPCRLMAGLDAFVGDLADQLVTCCYLLIDQHAHEVTVCSAGHLPVIAMPPEGPPHLLRAPISVPLGISNVPLGINSPPHEQTSEPLPAGSTLALYTDGLVERPGTDIDTQIDTLADILGTVLKEAPADPDLLERAADKIVATLIPDTTAHDDDVTLLLLRLPEGDPPGTPGTGVV
ncbi:SpoIIE family protein phosphatase [Streptomyces sp. NPDC000880]